MRRLAIGVEQMHRWLHRDDERLTFFGEDKGTIFASLLMLLHALNRVQRLSAMRDGRDACISRSTD
jgi:hypothetical protein